MNATQPDPDDPRALLMAGSADLPPGIDLLRGLRTRRAAAQRRARRRTRALLPAGAVAAAGAAALTTLLATSVGGAPSALAAVTSAMAKTSAQSYQFSLSSTGILNYDGEPLGSNTVSGAFDSRHKLGAEVLHTRGVVAQIRFIGGYVYTRVSPGAGVGSTGKPWDKAPIPPLSEYVHPGQDLQGYDAERPISPADLFAVLRSTATVRVVGPASGPDWTGTEYAITAGPIYWDNVSLAIRETVTGTVYVDKQGRVRRLVTSTSLANWPGHHQLQIMPMTVTDVLTFGGFETRVRVSPPPAGQVAYTAKPYWLFGI
jgi:hypothetical protein